MLFYTPQIGSLNLLLVARDAFGFSLNYFAGDYKPVDAAANSTQKPFLTQGLFDTYQGTNSTLNVELYNGNISSMLVNIPKLVDVKLNRYKYDQLNRLTAMDGYDGLDNSTNGWTSTSPTLSLDYKERISYDPNGNIITYLRNGAVAASGLAMDNLGYKYDYYVGTTRYSYTPGQTALPANARVTNRLNHVEDDAGGIYTEDIKTQLVNNYDYDEIGNLTADNLEGINSIVWNVYGKIKSITKNNLSINYTYDASGNRISKAVTQAGTTKTTWYVRDASGNVMSTYEYNGTHNNGHLTQTEIHLYGSNRLGLLNTTTNVQDLIMGNDITTVERGNKNYELSNHLQNVLVTVSDKRLQHSANGTSVDYYEADVISATDYYPFGQLQPGRQFGTKGRYGFNGKENDNDVSGDGNQYDYGFRIYNPRLGRFLSVDPLTQSYPWYTPYQFAGNKPIWATDVDGLEENTTSTFAKKPVVSLLKPTFAGVINITDANTQTAHKTFSGNFIQLRKADATGLASSIVNQLTHSDVGTAGSSLDLTKTGTRSQVSKSWKGTDIKYFTQYSYSFTSNNITEVGTFEMQSGQIQASARAWDPLLFLLVNKVVGSVFTGAVTTPQGKAIQSTTAEALEGSQKVYNGTTLYRLGTSGASNSGAEAQYWSLENPLSMSAEAYAKKYGIKLSRVQNADFIETATLKNGSKYITREAPVEVGAPAGAGGGVEAVVEKGGTTGNVITPLNRK